MPGWWRRANGAWTSCQWASACSWVRSGRRTITKAAVTPGVAVAVGHVRRWWRIRRTSTAYRPRSATGAIAARSSASTRLAKTGSRSRSIATNAVPPVALATSMASAPRLPSAAYTPRRYRWAGQEPSAWRLLLHQFGGDDVVGGRRRRDGLVGLDVDALPRAALDSVDGGLLVAVGDGQADAVLSGDDRAAVVHVADAVLEHDEERRAVVDAQAGAGA